MAKNYFFYSFWLKLKKTSLAQNKARDLKDEKPNKKDTSQNIPSLSKLVENKKISDHI